MADTATLRGRLAQRSPKQIARAIRRRAWRALFASGLPLPHALRSSYGPRLVTRRDDVTFGLCLAGSYGDFLSGFIERLDEPFVFLDIGANIGLYSLIAAASPHCVEALAFEPVPATYRYLVENCAINRAERVSPFCGAVTADPVGLVEMAFSSRHSGAAHIAGASGGWSAIRSLAIGPQTLDAALQRSRPTRIVVKIDVEGAEAAVLDVLQATASHRDIQDVFIEVATASHGAEGVARLYATLEALGLEEVGRSGDPAHYDAHFRRKVATGQSS